MLNSKKIAQKFLRTLERKQYLDKKEVFYSNEIIAQKLTEILEINIIVIK